VILDTFVKISLFYSFYIHFDCPWRLVSTARWVFLTLPFRRCGLDFLALWSYCDHSNSQIALYTLLCFNFSFSSIKCFQIWTFKLFLGFVKKICYNKIMAILFYIHKLTPQNKTEATKANWVCWRKLRMKQMRNCENDNMCQAILHFLWFSDFSNVAINFCTEFVYSVSFELEKTLCVYVIHRTKKNSIVP